MTPAELKKERREISGSFAVQLTLYANRFALQAR